MFSNCRSLARLARILRGSSGVLSLSTATSLAACDGNTEALHQNVPAAISALPGTASQSATAGSVVPTPPGVRVVNANGNPLRNVSVAFAVATGGGSISGGVATTNDNGLAYAARWTLGPAAGENTATATVTGLPPVTFTATGVAGTPAQLTKSTADPVNTVVATPATPAPGVLVKDVNGNPVAGVSVTFTVTDGRGSVTGAKVATNGSGIATVGSWTVGTLVGQNVLTATVTGVGAAAFVVTSVPAAVAVVTVNPLPVIVGIGQTQQLTAAATDQFGNVIPNSAIAFSSSAPSIATVSSAGLISGVSFGEDTVTAVVGAVSRRVPVSVIGHPASGSISSVLSNVNGRPFGVRIAMNGTIGVTQQDLNVVTLTDLAASRRTVPAGADPGDVVFTSSGSKAYVSAFNAGTITVVDVASGSAISTFSVASNAYRLALSPDDSRLFVTSTDGRVYVVNTATQGATPIALGGSLQGAILDPAGRFLYVTSTGGGLWKIDASTLQIDASKFVGGVLQDIGVSPNGAELYVADESGSVKILDATTLAARSQIAATGAFGLAVSRDGAQLYVTSPTSGAVFIVDIASRAVMKTLAVGGVPRRVAFDRFGMIAVAANEGNYVDVIK